MSNVLCVRKCQSSFHKSHSIWRWHRIYLGLGIQHRIQQMVLHSWGWHPSGRIYIMVVWTCSPFFLVLFWLHSFLFDNETFYPLHENFPEESRNTIAKIHLEYISSVAQSCPTLCNPVNSSTPGLPVHHQFPEFTQTHVHRVGDVIQPSHPLLSPSPPAPNPSQQQGLFECVNSSHEVAQVLEFQLQHQSFQWTPRTDLL